MASPRTFPAVSGLLDQVDLTDFEHIRTLSSATDDELTVEERAAAGAPPRTLAGSRPGMEAFGRTCPQLDRERLGGGCPVQEQSTAILDGTNCVVAPGGGRTEVRAAAPEP